MLRRICLGHNLSLCKLTAAVFFTLVLILNGKSLAQATPPVPEKVPPKRTSQIQDGFGINSDLPRDPYLPWNRWWWTRPARP